jgi:protein SCO1
MSDLATPTTRREGQSPLPTSPQSAPTTHAPEGRAPSPAFTRGAVLFLITLVVFGSLSVLLWLRRPPELHGILLEPPRQATEFRLTASTGQPIQLSDLRGKWVLFFVGYTYCPDVCPLTLAELKLMWDTLDESQRRRTQVVLITTDPERDTPERLAQYVAAFDPAFLGMTGTVEEIQIVAAQFGIFFERQPGTAESGYEVNHMSYVTIVDADGYVRMVLSPEATGKDMAADLRYLMRR